MLSLLHLPLFVFTIVAARDSTSSADSIAKFFKRLLWKRDKKHEKKGIRKFNSNEPYSKRSHKNEKQLEKKEKNTCNSDADQCVILCQCVHANCGRRNFLNRLQQCIIHLIWNQCIPVRSDFSLFSIHISSVAQQFKLLKYWDDFSCLNVLNEKITFVIFKLGNSLLLVLFWFSNLGLWFLLQIKMWFIFSF